MGRWILVVLIAVFAGTNTYADCDAKKAARNEAMDATIGVSGRCDKNKLAKDKKDDAKDKVDLDRDKNKKGRDRDKDRASVRKDKD